MSDWKERVSLELNDLNVKIGALNKFLTNEDAFRTVSMQQHTLMYLQLRTMQTYSEILTMRLAL
jgi:hypothetical protein